MLKDLSGHAFTGTVIMVVLMGVLKNLNAQMIDCFLGREKKRARNNGEEHDVLADLAKFRKL